MNALGCRAFLCGAGLLAGCSLLLLLLSLPDSLSTTAAAGIPLRRAGNEGFGDRDEADAQCDDLCLVVGSKIVAGSFEMLLTGAGFFGDNRVARLTAFSNKSSATLSSNAQVSTHT